MLKNLRTGGLVAALVLWTAPAWAAFGVSVAGEGIQIAPPADSTPFNLQNMVDEKDVYSVWFESAGTIPGGGISVDHDGTAGSYDGATVGGLGLGTTLGAGTQYRSYMVHLDPVLNYTMMTGPETTLTFGGKIIGISLFRPSLDAGDSAVGAGGTTYPTGLVRRGLDEAKTNDMFTVSALGKMLHVDFTANGDGFDQIRVFTMVPELQSLAIWLAIGAVIGTGAWWRQRKLAHA